MEFPDSRARAAWGVVGLVLGAVVAYVAYSFVGTLVLAVFVYYGTRPFYRRLKTRLRSRTLAAALALLALALPVVLLATYALAIGLQEFQRFQRTVDLGPVEDAIGPYLDISTLAQNPAAVLQDPSARRVLETTFQSLLDSLGFVGTGLLHLFVVFAAAFYMLKDGHRLSGWAVRSFGDADGVLVEYVDRVDRDLHSVFTGNLLNAVFTAAIGAVVYSLLDAVAPAAGIPYPALIGLLAGAASLVPVVGMKLVYVPVALYLFGTASLAGTPLWFPVAFAVASFVVVDTIPDLLLRPYVSGRDLHVGLVMFAYIFGPLLFGWYGLFLGPMLLVFVYHFGDYVVPELAGGGSIQPGRVDPSVADTAPGTEAMRRAPVTEEAPTADRGTVHDGEDDHHGAGTTGTAADGDTSTGDNDSDDP